MTAGFDHSKTAYPLTGRHAGVSCEKCHVPGRPMRLKHDRCTDCHADAHAGQLARRADGGRCESCHDVNGFRPARFGPEDHAKTAYPLLGAHLAVACDQCHRPGVAGAPRTPSVPLHFASTRCADCHKDPHQGEVARFVAKGGCETCHRVDSWRAGRVRPRPDALPALGEPRPRGLRALPPPRRGPRAGRRSLRFAGVPQSCEGCHRDPHQGQFARRGRRLCLRALPHDRQPEGVEVRPRPRRRLPPGRRPRPPRLLGLPPSRDAKRRDVHPLQAAPHDVQRLPRPVRAAARKGEKP